ncbi:hypothetical protein NBO_642g0001 [Nosema bombycis CQ1]|uniref:Uncharacterized protein n=1 Tax=Nosema bombycis (strain CQ1 / CVCC 102059) TaxID=578461 RepID=R0KP24_NOSB1|nr:hypothetical protein NBO_642g0001 [Nosema bombycis CQ1]|eukprot:EOB11917.1 hypothetical protein NBO_642g0001 [Nosema bombycis CQ1]
MFRNIINNFSFIFLISNLRSIYSSSTENSYIIENITKPFSKISLNKQPGVMDRRRFINSIKKRINYDSITSGEIEKLGWNRNLLETELNQNKDCLNKILNSVEKNHYHLPENEFYEECYENGLFSKIFTISFDKNSINVVHFFIFSKVLLEKSDLVEEKENKIIADKFYKVLECAKRILIFHSSLFSTLQIIKESEEVWESYYNDEEKNLFYAFILIKSMLSNSSLAFITNMNVDTKHLCDSGLNDFQVDAFEINAAGEKIKRTVWLSTYILSHISAIFDIIKHETIMKNSIFNIKIISRYITYD